jgi:hypothetical protein
MIVGSMYKQIAIAAKRRAMSPNPPAAEEALATTKESYLATSDI